MNTEFGETINVPVEDAVSFDACGNENCSQTICESGANITYVNSNVDVEKISLLKILSKTFKSKKAVMEKNDC